MSTERKTGSWDRDITFVINLPAWFLFVMMTLMIALAIINYQRVVEARKHQTTFKETIERLQAENREARKRLGLK
jgi:hypothetical protein